MTEKDLAFSVAEFESRLEALRERLRERGVDGMLIHTPENIYYLSGFQTAGYYAYQTLVVPGARTIPPILVLRRLEEANVNSLSWVDARRGYVDTQDPVAVTVDALRDIGLADKTLGIETDSWFLTVKHYERLRQLLPGAHYVDCAGLVEQGRLIKSDAEIAYIRAGARAAEATLEAAIQTTAAGTTENHIAAEMHRAGIMAGSEYTSLPHFIGSGPRGAKLTHGTWAGRRIEVGDVIYYEVSGTVRRYSAALYRGVTVEHPSERVQKMAEVCIAGLERVLETMRPGVQCREVAEAWASEIVKGGFPRPYRRAGYSMGISFPPDWGEGHILSLRFDESRPLSPGMVFHVISSIRDEGIAVTGSSETILITERGCEVVTQFPRKLFVR